MKKIYILLLLITISILLVIMGNNILENKKNKDEKKRLTTAIKEKERQVNLLVNEICNINEENIKRRLKELHKEKQIIWKKGFALKNNKILLLDPIQIQQNYIDFNLSRKQIKESSNEVLKFFEILWGPTFIITYDSHKTNPYFTLPQTQKKFCIKIEGYTLYLKDPLDENGSWEPLEIRYIKEIKKEPFIDVDGFESPHYPCMLVFLETKWFKGEYELWCED